MPYIDLQNANIANTLSQQGFKPEIVQKTVELVWQACERFYSLNRKNEHIYKMLCSGDVTLNKYLIYKKLTQKDKQEWAQVKNLKTGDRGYACRYLIAELEKRSPELCRQHINPKFTLQVNENHLDAPDIATEIDALLLLYSVPGYFSFIDKLAQYKKGTFSTLKRNYIDFMIEKGLFLISQYLLAFEKDLSIPRDSVTSDSQLMEWDEMEVVINRICDRADPHHDDPIKLSSINDLRSIYVSLFNVAIGMMADQGNVPYIIRQFLPTIPDRLDFTKEKLEHDNAWKRYQDHHFLFMRLQKDQKEKLTAALSKLTPEQRVVWMGSLGKQEIRALILPMVSQRNRFENLVSACHSIPPSDNKQYPFSSRVWEVLCDLYNDYFRDKNNLSEDIESLFGNTKIKKPTQTAVSTETKDQEKEDYKEALTIIREFTFLVVDDSEKIRAMTINVLKKEGVTKIYEATNGVEAWELIQKTKLDVILCDWLMPEMSGIELVQKMMQVENLAKSTAFLMLTTVNDKASIVEALSVGVRGYLIKPFTRRQLLEKVCFATKWLQKERQEGTIFPSEKK